MPLRRELRGMESNECIRPLSKAMPAKAPIDWSKWGIADQQGGYRYRDPYKYYNNFSGNTAHIYKVGEDEATFRERVKNFACKNWQASGSCDRPHCPYSHDPKTWKAYDKDKVLGWKNTWKSYDSV